MRKEIKTALVHDWVVDIGGAESCLQSIHKLYPSDLFALVCRRESLEKLGLGGVRLETSFLDKLPNILNNYRNYLLLFPYAVERFDLSPYDVVISSSHACAKGVLTSSEQLHICYCYTPIRYAWDLYAQYLREAGLETGLKGLVAKWILHYIRLWDSAAAGRPDYYVAISNHIARRIKKTYGRVAAVIYPPVDVNNFTINENKKDFYLAASRMVPYKKMDLIATAFSAMPDKKLVIIGDGPDFKKVKAASGGNVQLLGRQPTPVLKDYLQRAKAFVFAAEEDFGILPVEAQACGTPVIAYGKGGALETVTEGETGVFFREQTAQSLQSAVAEFEKNTAVFAPAACRKNAERFSKERFEREFREFTDSKIKEFLAGKS
ncbi:MAG: glycosyltransferase [Elusimicrobiales bacterium]|nr:glycosyltransferase [Elusimicrobiales bacterium]